MAELELLTGWLAGQQRGGWPLLWIGQLGLCHLGVEEQEADQVVHNRASLLCHKQDISLNSVGHHLVGKDIELPVNHHCCLSPLVLQFACYHITGCVYYEDALWVVWNAQSKVSGSINGSRKEPFFFMLELAWNVLLPAHNTGLLCQQSCAASAERARGPSSSTWLFIQSVVNGT